MRRPLFAVALCLVVLAVLRLQTGTAQIVDEDCISAWSLSAADRLRITGQVYRKEEEGIYLKSVVLLNSDVYEQSAAESQQAKSISENLICEIPQASTIPLGATVTLEGSFMPFSHATNPGQFDSAIYYRTLGIGGKIREAELLCYDDGSWPIREALYGLKIVLTQRIYQIFPEQEAGIVEALLLGEKGNLDGELKELYRRNGILHILSISSMHITIIGMTVYKLLRKMRLPVWLSALAGGILLIFYGVLTGFGVSAIRAIGMYLLRMLGEVVGRTYDMLTGLGLVGGIMVTVNPYYLQNGGFLLSFGCVLGIGILYPALLPELPRRQPKNRPPKSFFEKILEWVLQKEPLKLCIHSFLLSLSVTLATLPLQLSLYYEVPIYSVFLNLLIVPFLKPMMISGILALALPFLKIFPGVVCVILDGYEFACQCFERLPIHTWNPGAPQMWQIVVYYVLLLLVAGWLDYRKRAKKKCMGVLCAAILVGAIAVLGIRLRSTNTVTFLDVGQGDCIVVQTASGENYLFDCGSTNISQVGKYVLLPYLKYCGIRRLDGVFVSHPDGDHASGILELFSLGAENGIVIEQLILPDIEDSAVEEHLGEMRQAALEMKQQEPVSIRFVSAGDSWQCESADFLCLHPGENYSAADKNSYSECFYVEFFEEASGKLLPGEGDENWSLLLTGDVEGEGEECLMQELQSRRIGDVTVLKVAHHGSKNASSEEILEILNPDVAIISCGKNNIYGHPHEETLERLEKVESAVLSTVEYGAITIEGGKTVRVYGVGK